MKHALLLSFSLLASAALFGAPTGKPVNPRVAQALSRLGGPSVDVPAMIKATNQFLKSREPEMTGEEYALYERVVAMLDVMPDLALSLLEEMRKDPKGTSPAFRFILANAYYANGKVDQAEQLYAEATTQLPEFLRAWNNLGIILYEKGEYERASVSLGKAIALGDRTPITYGVFGYCMEQTGNLVSAEAAYLQALAGDPTKSEWTEGLLRIYINGKQWGRAEPLARMLARYHPNEARHWTAYANVLIAMEKRLEALAVLEVAKAGPGLPLDGQLLLADLYAELKFNQEAYQVYAEISRSAESLGFQRLLRFARYLISERAGLEAERCLATLAQNPSAKEDAGFFLAQAELAALRNDSAAEQKVLNALLATKPFQPEGLLRLARLHLRENRPSDASFVLAHAVEIPESAYEALLELVNLELKEAHYTEALDYAQRALQLRHSASLEEFVTRIQTLASTRT